MTRRPPFLKVPRAKSALTRLTKATRVAAGATISDTFDSLDNFKVIGGNPSISSGRLIGRGAVLHRDQALTDNYTVTATIGTESGGKTWLVTCASASMDSFYALEVHTGTSLNVFNFVKGTRTPSLGSSLFGVLTRVIVLIHAFFYSVLDDLVDLLRHATTGQTVEPGDEITVWWDEDTSTLRALKNGNQVTSLVVDPWEIPHGDGFRYWGVVQGVDPLGVGVRFTDIEAQDVLTITGS